MIVNTLLIVKQSQQTFNKAKLYRKSHHSKSHHFIFLSILRIKLNSLRILGFGFVMAQIRIKNHRNITNQKASFRCNG